MRMIGDATWAGVRDAGVRAGRADLTELGAAVKGKIPAGSCLFDDGRSPLFGLARDDHCALWQVVKFRAVAPMTAVTFPFPAVGPYAATDRLRPK